MPIYAVKHKAHIRATITEELAHDGRGNTYTIRNAGRPVRFEVGAVISDVTTDEMTAFPDRFELVAGEPLILPGPTQPVPRLNPELFALLRRSHAGETTLDEQEVVGPLVLFLEQYAMGTTTPAETAALEALLKDFGIPLFV